MNTKYPIEILMDNNDRIFNSIMKMNDCFQCGETILKEEKKMSAIDEDRNRYHRECYENLL
ncbi:MAG: hypothetical protein AABY22_16505 [Nanoarchaeota archaeon]|mgnify:CR=1 FL=1